MFHHTLSAFSQPVTVLHPGELIASAEDIIISTVLGSCVGVCLYDERLNLGGLNHFMLAGEFREGHKRNDPSRFIEESARYGLYAMELLINELLKLGAVKKRLKAKVFGGACMFSSCEDGQISSVPQANVAFALDFLKTEGIPVIKSDTGGRTARKIYFFPKTGKVLLKRVHGSLLRKVESDEHGYLRRIEEKRLHQGELILFKEPPKKSGS
jgi:chemotaxis protein CheD